jgi:LL-diaminopimelate aminotransferase
VDALRSAGFTIDKPKATFYLYVKAPKSTKDGSITFDSGEAFSQYLIKEKMISTVPWDDAGNFIRFSVTFIAKDEADEERVMAEIKQRLGSGEFIFD